MVLTTHLKRCWRQRHSLKFKLRLLCFSAPFIFSFWHSSHRRNTATSNAINTRKVTRFSLGIVIALLWFAYLNVEFMGADSILDLSCLSVRPHAPSMKWPSFKVRNCSPDTSNIWKCLQISLICNVFERACSNFGGEICPEKWSENTKTASNLIDFTFKIICGIRSIIIINIKRRKRDVWDNHWRISR